MKKETNINQKGTSVKNDDQNIEWDNGEVTYGHSIIQSEFKKKNQPDESHFKKQPAGENSDTINDLKNQNLSQQEDIGNRNDSNEKGIGGKDL